MLDLFRRQAYHLELVLVPTPQDAPPIFFGQIVDELKAYIDSGEAVYVYDNDTKAIRARQCWYDEDQQILILLVNYADANVADPAFENLNTGDLRFEPKLRGEGIAVSTHLAIDLMPNEPNRPFYSAYLEDVPGVGRTKLTPFITALIREGCDPVLWKDPAGAERKSRPTVKLNGSMSQTLQKDLEKGKLSYIELSKHNVKSKFDEDGRVQEDVRSVRLKVLKHAKDHALDIISSVRKRAKDEGYTDMKVTYARATGKQTSKRFGTAREDASDVLTIEVSEVALNNPRQQCEPTLREDVIEKLCELIISKRN